MGELALLAALLAAHLVADFPLQTNWMAANKHTDSTPLTVHAAVHGCVTAVFAAAGTGRPVLGVVSALLVAVMHGWIDRLDYPIRWDQTAHLAILVVLWVVLQP